MNEKDVKWIVKNWGKIPDSFKTDIHAGHENHIPGVSMEGHIVVLLLDRQKPSVEVNYDFDEERIGVNRFGEIIWGFDSGCSCPSPWDDSYPGCYNRGSTWKAFIVEAEQFDNGFLDVCDEKLNEIKKHIKR